LSFLVIEDDATEANFNAANFDFHSRFGFLFAFDSLMRPNVGNSLFDSPASVFVVAPIMYSMLA
jgi:hypothetical protein